MIRSVGPTGEQRKLETAARTADLAIVGGGLAGVCCAITAAREGVKVVLVQDRPVLGGNASSEVRLWVLGATSHMGNNNRWAREGGVIDEILVENLWRNPEGNALLFDSILLEKVSLEPNIMLLLNTAVDSVDTAYDGSILNAHAFCGQNQLRYEIAAPLFCDASGDGILGFLSGAAFRMGAESREEFDEKFAPTKEYGELLGHSLYFSSRDAGRPVRYVAPAFALKDIRAIPRYKELRPSDTGCRLWWLEYGGRLDTIRETETIKWELWKVAYGVWDYIKNSGNFPEAENLTLEWMGTIPGKRESRRFEGDLILSQKDIVEQRTHPDAVSFGGWAMDLHPSDGVYSDLSGCTQWHSKGIYQIPYRTMYSRNVPNLFLAGRLLSASHVAFGSTRVMATSAHNGQAVGMAAALCTERRMNPRDLLQPQTMHTLQQHLLRSGQYIPGLRNEDSHDLARTARVSASSSLAVCCLPADGCVRPLDAAQALLLPVPAGSMPDITLVLDAATKTELHIELRSAALPGNYTPDVLLQSMEIVVDEGKLKPLHLHFETPIERDAYVFVVLRPNSSIAVHESAQRLTGILTLAQTMNAAVAKSSRQSPPDDTGVDSFEFWLPSRRPKGKNLAVTLSPPLHVYAPANVTNGLARPYLQTNAWVPAAEDKTPTLRLEWDTVQTIKTIELSFDTDFDHPMESVLMEHPERTVPFCIKSYRVLDDTGNCIFTEENNHQTRNVINLPQAVATKTLSIEALDTWGCAPAIFEVRCYEE